MWPRCYLDWGGGLSLDGTLVDFSGTATKEAEPLPLEPSLAGMGKVAKTITRL